MASTVKHPRNRGPELGQGQPPKRRLGVRHGIRTGLRQPGAGFVAGEAWGFQRLTPLVDMGSLKQLSPSVSAMPWISPGMARLVFRSLFPKAPWCAWA